MKMSYKIALLVAIGVFALALLAIARSGDESQDTNLADATETNESPEPAPRKSLLSEPSTDGSAASLTRDTPKPEPEPTRGNLLQDVRSRINAASAEQPADKPDTSVAAKPEETETPGTSTATEEPGPSGAIPLTRTDAGNPSLAAANKPAATSATKPDATPTASAVNRVDLDAILGGQTRPTPSASTDSGATATAAKPAAGDTYIVQPNDTFTSISAKLYGTEGRWVDIAQANPLVDPTKLQVGQVLRLPGVNQPKLSAEEDTPSRPGDPKNYIIQPGDTLSTVAEKEYGDPNLWRVIYNFNRQKIGDNPNAIQAGMVLKIPPRVSGAQ